MWLLLKIVFPSPVFIKIVSMVSLASYANGGLSEMRGKNMQYSKFWNFGVDEKKSPAVVKKGIEIPSRIGMIVAYTPAFLAGIASFGIFPDEGMRFLLLKSALTFHFFKRIFEVVFIHKYSGGMAVDTMIPISLSYFISTAITIYAQHLTQGIQEPSIDLIYPGIALFFVGISGNFYHHCLLSKLRSNNNKNDKEEYKIPKGGLFDLVICPHYLFEIVGFLGISCISQTLFAYCYTLGTTFYLVGRSHATKRWYLSKFGGDLPKDVKEKKSAVVRKGIEIPSRIGMIVAYTAAFLAGIASFGNFPDEEGMRFSFVKSALTFHFFKRIFEVLSSFSR